MKGFRTLGDPVLSAGLTSRNRLGSRRLGGGGVDVLSLFNHYWNLDEASGERADAIGSYPLTDFNTVTQSSGVSAATGNCAEFTRLNSERLQRAADSSPDLNAGAFSFFGCCWMKLKSAPANMAIMAKDTGANPRDYNLIYEVVTNQFRWTVYNAAGIVGLVNSDETLSLNTFTFVAFGYDHDLASVWISVNAGTKKLVAVTADPAGSTRQFYLGAIGGDSFFDGMVDAAGFGSANVAGTGNPTQAQLTALYAGGQGIQHPF